MGATARWAIPYPEYTDNADVPQWMEDQAVSLDDHAKDDQGVFASRPAAGNFGSYYFATDQDKLYRDDGSVWNEVLIRQDNTITAAEIAADAVGSSEIAAGAVGVSEVADGTLTPVEMASGLTFFKAVSIATEESRTNTSYGTLTTPDQITSVIVPTNGIVRIGFQGMWKESVQAAGRAAVFIGANQIKAASPNGPQTVAAKRTSGSAGNYAILCSFAGGLLSSDDGTYTGDVTTGQIMGWNNGATAPWELGGSPQALTAAVPYAGWMETFVASGTYTISVQFKSSSGSVTAKNRKLWVEVLSPQ